MIELRPLHAGYVLADEAPLRGAIKAEAEDFVVEELPAYAASGEGTHLYLQIEKRGLTTRDAVRLLARELGRPERDFGYAGLKDARAVTRQRLSIEHVPIERLQGFTARGLRVLDIERHGNKLKPGHLRGNRFEILLRGADPSEAERARQMLLRLAERGVPNAFGMQRFGRAANNHRLGRALLLGDATEFVSIWLGEAAPNESAEHVRVRELCRAGHFGEALSVLPRGFHEERSLIAALAEGEPADRAVRRLGLGLKRFFVSAWQSALFQRVLAQRLPTFDQVEVGDIAFLHRNGACFEVLDAEAEAARARAFELSPSGPLFGERLLSAQGAPGALEASVLEEDGLRIDQLAAAEKLAPRGERRALRFALVAPEVHGEPAGLRLKFELAPGCYATTVLDELTQGGIAEEVPLHADEDSAD